MSNKMMDFGSVLVFLDDVVALEKGKWDDVMEDWLAILVTQGGARIPTTVYRKTARDVLEKCKALNAFEKAAAGLLDLASPAIVPLVKQVQRAHEDHVLWHADHATTNGKNCSYCSSD